MKSTRIAEDQLSASLTPGLPSPERRAFIALAGASAGATLLSACGGGGSGTAFVAPAPAPSAAAAPPIDPAPAAAAPAPDPIWGPAGLGTQIVAALKGINTSMFPAVDFPVNMNRGGFVKDFYVDGVTLPHGVSLSGAGYGSSMLPGSPINSSVPIGVSSPANCNPSASQGGIITFDCDYQPSKDAIRTRPAALQNIQISNLVAQNVSLGGKTGSCFQAIVAQGPVAFDYNGPSPAPAVPAIEGVRIIDCDFGTPIASGPASATTAGPIYAYNVHDIALVNTLIAGRTLNTTVSDPR